MSEIKKILDDGKKDAAGQSGDQKDPDVTQLKTDLTETKGKLTELEKKNAELEFSNLFKDVCDEYPGAKEFKADIQEKVNKGYSVKDAAVAILNEKGKLKTAAQIRQESDASEGFGGSSVRTNNQSKGKKTLEELRKDFQDLEAKGEIKLT